MENNNNISISKNAAKKINNIIATQDDNSVLKISVLGGGCAGFSYQFDLVKELKEGDFLLEENGAKVLIDEISIPYLAGTEIDYVRNLVGSNFDIKNPNAESACGCGTSFSM